jgi:hypothetical protein
MVGERRDMTLSNPALNSEARAELVPLSCSMFEFDSLVGPSVIMISWFLSLVALKKDDDPEVIDIRNNLTVGLKLPADIISNFTS